MNVLKSMETGRKTDSPQALTLTAESNALGTVNPGIAGSGFFSLDHGLVDLNRGKTSISKTCFEVMVLDESADGAVGPVWRCF